VRRQFTEGSGAEDATVTGLPTAAAEPELATTSMRATGEGIHLTAPFEVRDDVMGDGLALSAVLGLEAVPEVLAMREGQEGRVVPPPGTCEPTGLSDRGGPQPRVARERGCGASPEPDAAGGVLRPHGWRR
jgi:hypothetical protein